MLFAETEESQDLFVELGVHGLKLLLDVSSEVAGVLIVRQRLAGFIFSFTEVLCRGSGDSVEGHGRVLVVSDLLKVHVRNFLVACDGGVVSHNVSG